MKFKVIEHDPRQEAATAAQATVHIFPEEKSAITPGIYSKEQIEEVKTRVSEESIYNHVNQLAIKDCKVLLSALATAEQELDALKSLIKMVRNQRDKYFEFYSGISNEKSDELEKLEKICSERDTLKSRVAELEARLQAPQAYADIMAERKRQDEKWGVQRHHPVEWLSILGEEFGEVCKAVCEAHFNGYASTGIWDQYRVELVHAAAVAVSMIECHDAILGEKGD